jgi:hypothetical protein
MSEITSINSARLLDKNGTTSCKHSPTINRLWEENINCQIPFHFSQPKNVITCRHLSMLVLLQRLAAAQTGEKFKLYRDLSSISQILHLVGEQEDIEKRFQEIKQSPVSRHFLCDQNWPRFLAAQFKKPVFFFLLTTRNHAMVLEGKIIEGEQTRYRLKFYDPNHSFIMQTFESTDINTITCLNMHNFIQQDYLTYQCEEVIAYEAGASISPTQQFYTRKQGHIWSNTEGSSQRKALPPLFRGHQPIT